MTRPLTNTGDLISERRCLKSQESLLGTDLDQVGRPTFETKAFLKSNSAEPRVTVARRELTLIVRCRTNNRMLVDV